MSKQSELVGLARTTNLDEVNAAYSAGSLSNRNLIINGAMQVAQRGTSASPAPIGFLIDRFATFKSGGGAYSIAQSTDAPVGFSHSMLLTVTSASTPSGGDYYLTQQVIEGYNASVLSLGTSSAQGFTLSFYVKSSLTGTFSGSFRDGVEALTYAFEYTINSANTWERKTVFVDGTSSGTFPTNNTASLKLCFSLGQGTTYATSTVGSWTSGSYHGSTTETDFISNSGATLNITGVQLEVGDTATPFEHRSYGQELALCQRYFEKNFNVFDAPVAGLALPDRVSGLAFAGSAYGFNLNFSVTKRSLPTMVYYRGDTAGSASSGTVCRFNGVGWVEETITGSGRQTTQFIAQDVSTSGLTVGYTYLVQVGFTADAEL